MDVTNVVKMVSKTTVIGVAIAASLSVATAFAESFKPVPGYIPPLTLTTTPDYEDDTRGVFVPSHQQHRLKNYGELQGGGDAKFQPAEYSPNGMMLAQAGTDSFERELNRISNGHMGYEAEMNRVSSDRGMVALGSAPMHNPNMNAGYPTGMAGGMNHLQSVQPSGMPQGQINPYMVAQAPVANPNNGQMAAYNQQGYGLHGKMENGIEIAVGSVQRRTLDMQNSLARLREDRISVRRALQRMMDQIGGGEWTIVWDLAEQNAGLPEMEISIYAEEPFSNVLNALLARVQTRSGQPLRVIRYDNTQRLVITDRQGGYRLSGKTSTVGVGDSDDPVAVTENVLKESMVSLHYDEVPLVDALENIVNQAGKGEWRLRVYAGLDQVLKPAHVEEPFNIAMERLLKLFNLKYEVFPGGKLIVVTHNSRLGFTRGE